MTRTLSTSLNDGSGTFSPGHAPPVEFASAVSLRDLDADGFPEALVTDQLTGEIRVLRNDGSSTWQPLEPLVIDERPAAIAAGDFDDDGRYDVATTGATVGRMFNETEGQRARRGDGNDDGSVTAADNTALIAELYDGDGARVEAVPRGSFLGGAGADADGDGVISRTDLHGLLRRLTGAVDGAR